MWVKVIIVIAFIGIVVSLASGLFYMVKDKGDSTRTVRALTWRVGISVGLFAFLMILVGLGVIKPHGLYPERPAISTPDTKAGS